VASALTKGPTRVVETQRTTGRMTASGVRDVDDGNYGGGVAAASRTRAG
jgi:hypothetical protein